MGKPEKKLKKILRILGITGAVYGVFRFLLPLVVPFLFAVIFALWLEPSARRISKHLSWKIPGFKRKLAVPAGAAAVMELLIFLAVLAGILCIGSRKVIQEMIRLSERVPIWIQQADSRLTALCRLTEQKFGLKSDLAVLTVRTMLRDGILSFRQRAMAEVVNHSTACLRFFVYAGVFCAIVLIATGLLVQELETWKRWVRQSEYAEEWERICARLTSAGTSYLRTQLILLGITTMICVIGFWMMKNPYYLVAGIAVGVLDALPVFGVGTVLVPWAVLMMIAGRWKRALFLLAIYVVCYFLREILEAKLMSRDVGMTPFETLLSMYVGLELFGISGFLLGPAGFLLICDLSEIWTDENSENPAGDS